jgi:hypothetical protein
MTLTERVAEGRRIFPSPHVSGERVGVRGSIKKYLTYCFYCNPSSCTFSPLVRGEGIFGAKM